MSVQTLKTINHFQILSQRQDAAIDLPVNVFSHSAGNLINFSHFTAVHIILS